MNDLETVAPRAQVIAAQPGFFVLTLMGIDEDMSILMSPIIGWLIEGENAFPLTSFGTRRSSTVLHPGGLIESENGWWSNAKDWVLDEMEEHPRYAGFLQNRDALEC
ncbi:hypothetical protein [Methylocella tundrae]|uniref:hypothetical protein n=1 Tax=Methylocella tundrae TaxID=227605 RepID=UPI00106C224E|nr:hypothetical protein [Methylocella tundrae]